MLKNLEQESGRSMVEMLGVLAIMGVLSVGGISGYTTAMNKHKANEILDAARLRAMSVSAQLQNGKEVGDATLDEFDDEDVGGANFGDIEDAGNNRFIIAFDKAPDEDVLKQMQNIAGTDGVVRDVKAVGITYNNDLSTDTIASDYQDEGQCTQDEQRKWCDGGCHDQNYECVCSNGGMIAPSNDYGVICCKDGVLSFDGENYNTSDYSSVSMELCGCPDHGTLIDGDMGIFCCKDGFAYNPSTGDYTLFETYDYPTDTHTICGYPSASSCKNGGSVAPHDTEYNKRLWYGNNLICCKEGTISYDGEDYTTPYASVEIALCGCPDHGTPVDAYDSDGELDTCCKGGFEYNWETGKYDAFQPAQTRDYCGYPTDSSLCKDGGTLAPQTIPEAQELWRMNSLACCKKGMISYDGENYQTVGPIFDEIMLCGCPNDGTPADSSGDSLPDTCCKDGFEYNWETGKYDFVNLGYNDYYTHALCGYPTDQSLCKDGGSLAPHTTTEMQKIWNQVSVLCCKEGMVSIDGGPYVYPTYSEVLLCGCPDDGTPVPVPEYDGAYCCKDGFELNTETGKYDKVNTLCTTS